MFENTTFFENKKLVFRQIVNENYNSIATDKYGDIYLNFYNMIYIFTPATYQKELSVLIYLDKHVDYIYRSYPISMDSDGSIDTVRFCIKDRCGENNETYYVPYSRWYSVNNITGAGYMQLSNVNKNVILDLDIMVKIPNNYNGDGFKYSLIDFEYPDKRDDYDTIRIDIHIRGILVDDSDSLCMRVLTLVSFNDFQYNDLTPKYDNVIINFRIDIKPERLFLIHTPDPDNKDIEDGVYLCIISHNHYYQDKNVDNKFKNLTINITKGILDPAYIDSIADIAETYSINEIY